MGGVILHGYPSGSLTISQEAVGNLTKGQATSPWPKTVVVTQHQAEALERILERDRTAWITHGGLKGLLGISDSDVLALADVVKALKG